jgi:hypothetical protein
MEARILETTPFTACRHLRRSNAERICAIVAEFREGSPEFVRGQGARPLLVCQPMNSSFLSFDQDIDADDTVRVSALSPESLPSLDPPPRDADIPAKSALSFALLTELRSLTPTLQRAASREPPPRRRTLRSSVASSVAHGRIVWNGARGFARRTRDAMRPHAARALAWNALVWQIAIAFVVRTCTSLRARAERGFTASRPHIVAWARVAQGHAKTARRRLASFSRLPGRQDLARAFHRTRA